MMDYYFDYASAEAIYLVYTYQSVSAAARRLGVTQAALSQRVQAAEKRCGIQIFNRKSNKMVPTAEGRDYIRLCEIMVHEGTALIKKFHAKADNAQQEITIATSPAISGHIIPLLLRGYDVVRPNVSLKINASIDKPTIASGDVLIYPRIHNNANLEQVKLYDMPQSIYGSKDYLKKYGTPTKIEDLVDHRLLAVDTQSLSHVYSNVNWLLHYGISDVSQARKPSLTYTVFDARVTAMKAGLGLTSTYPMYLKAVGDENVVRVLPDVTHVENTIYFITNKTESENPIVADLLRVIRANVESLLNGDGRTPSFR